MVWASKTIKVINNVHKTIGTGYHSENVWISILFQLLISMIVMISKNIMFQDFSIENNVFIKDLNFNETNIGIWKYIFDKIEFNIPNYGYLLVIDSNFADLTGTDKYKIKAFFMGDKNIFLLGLKKMIEIFNANKFSKIPSKFVIGIISKINEKLQNILATHTSGSDKESLNKLKKIPLEFAKLMSDKINLFNSRVGTILKETELIYMSDDFNTDTPRGSMVVINHTTSIKIFGILLEETENEKYLILRTKKCINSIDDRSNNPFKTEEVDISSLKNYNITPEPMYEPNKLLNVLETYYINI